MRRIAWTPTACGFGRHVTAALLAAAGLSVASLGHAEEAANPFAGFETPQLETGDGFRAAEAPLDLTSEASETVDASQTDAALRTASHESSPAAGEGTIQQVGWQDQPIRQTAAAQSDNPFAFAAEPPTLPGVAPTATAAPQAARSVRPAQVAAASAEQAAAIDLVWTPKGPVDLGQPCQCTLEVANRGTLDASNVSVEAHFPPTVRLTAVEPQPTTASSFLGWDLGTVAASESRLLELTYVPSASGDLEPRAAVRFTTMKSAKFAVVSPQLKAELVRSEAPGRVGEPVPQLLRLSNPGSGIARDVQVEVTVPEGLSHPQGDRLITEVGPLHPGEVRTLRIALAALRGGEHRVDVRATGDGNLLATASTTVAIASPRLTTSIDGPKLRYLGRTGTFELSVTNEGASPDDNVRLMHKLPEGYAFVSASNGSRYDATSGIVSWFLGRLEAGQTRSVSVELKAAAAGEQTHFVRATGEQGVKADTQLASRVEAVSLLHLEVADLDDPVEVGREVAYEIRITNEGSAPAQQVSLVCELPEGCTLAGAEAATGYRTSGSLVTFQPLSSLAPGQTETVQLKLTGSKAGRTLFRARVSSGTAEPITAEESTRFYGE